MLRGMVPSVVPIVLVLGTVVRKARHADRGGRHRRIAIAARHGRPIWQETGSPMRITATVVVILIGSTRFPPVFADGDGGRRIEPLLAQRPGDRRRRGDGPPAFGFGAPPKIQ